MSLPNRRWYISLSTIVSSSVSLSLWLGSIGVHVGLHANFPISLRRSITYFCWKIKIPCLECATSILRKYFNLPNYLISNSLVKHCLKVCFTSSPFPVMMMLSTYTKRVVTPPESKCLMNNVWSSWLYILYFFITFANLPKHALGDCFSPNRAFFSLHTFLVARSLLNPRGISMKISSSKYPYKNAFLTSKYCRSQL